MLFREDPEGLIVIAQPTHAWVSGQIARAWGNGRFGAVEPREEVCLAAEQHDNGWAAWEMAPTLNPETGRPHTFMDLPRATHLEIWSAASRWALTLGRYPALLVSLHGAGLYAGAAAEPDEAVREFLAREEVLQAELLASLRADPRYAPWATDEAVARNRRLVAVWDAISLAVCGGLPRGRWIPDVPSSDEPCSLMLAPSRSEPDTIVVDAWPFAVDRLTLTFEGRRLGSATFSDEAELRAALERAPWVSLAVTLRPA